MQAIVIKKTIFTKSYSVYVSKSSYKYLPSYISNTDSTVGIPIIRKKKKKHQYCI